ncbi:MAG: hypothetical protein ACI8WB_000576 [Phenylobacterium sp.]|jgi:hypothetical protein
MTHQSNTHAIRKFIAGSLTTTVLGMTALSSMAAFANDYKHVAVPPQHMDAQKMPSAQSKGIFSHSSMLPVFTSSLQNVAGSAGLAQQIEQTITLDGAMDSPVVWLSPDAGQWFMSVTNPKGEMVYDELSAATKSLAVSDIKVGPQSFIGKKFSIQKPSVGQWTIKLTRKANASTASKSASKASKSDIAGYLLFKGDTSLQAYSYLDNNFTTENNDINIVAHVADTTLNRGQRQLMVQKDPLLSAIDSAVATVKSPSGKYVTLTLNDKGIMGDKVAGDGRFSAKLPTDEIGVYTNQVQINGRHANGNRFSRTTTDIYPIAAVSFDFTDGAAQLKQVDNTSALLSVPVKQLGDAESVYMAAEVWGTNADGEQQSAAWVGGIVAAKDAKGETSLDLAFDTRWLTRNNLSAPYTLKSVRLQTVDGNVPLAQRNELSLQTKTAIKSLYSVSGEQHISTEITQDMLMGKAPARSKSKGPQSVENESSATGSKLLLVHGYCSGQAWQESHFYDADEFQNYNQSISHNTFANRVKDFGAQYNSYGIVAHSQGGAASLELYAKYYSGLDNASSGSLIQSVGTPYQGTALAGNLAALGDVFGAGCGTNTDLTYSGATNWLATIPTWARNKVDYYTTSFNTRWWAYDYCHLATDLFLNDPEDGTTEQWSGQLSGGVNKGHTKGQCHTGGMRDPAQTKDTGRNSSMSSRAAR